MILNPHRFRSASTCLQNSASLSGCAWPVSISRSRRSTSAISCPCDHSSSTGGKDRRIDSASSTRCSTGSASTVFSISSIAAMPLAYGQAALLQESADGRLRPQDLLWVGQTQHAVEDKFAGEFVCEAGCGSRWPEVMPYAASEIIAALNAINAAAARPG